MYLKQDLYLFFGDLVKCFDKLWLKDCLVDLHSAGAREREVKILYLLNKSATAKIITPVGITNEISISETVKQGTVFAPKLCCASTGKLNNMSKPMAVRGVRGKSREAAPISSLSFNLIER